MNFIKERRADGKCEHCFGNARLRFHDVENSCPYCNGSGVAAIERPVQRITWTTAGDVVLTYADHPFESVTLGNATVVAVKEFYSAHGAVIEGPVGLELRRPPNPEIDELLRK